MRRSLGVNGLCLDRANATARIPHPMTQVLLQAKIYAADFMELLDRIAFLASIEVGHLADGLSLVFLLLGPGLLRRT